MLASQDEARPPRAAGTTAPPGGVTQAVTPPPKWPPSIDGSAVVRDPDLDAALRRAAALLGDKPAATLVRELALRGADAISAAPGAEIVRRLVTERGARPAEGSLLEFLDERGAWGELDPSRRASGLLEELRADDTP